MSIKLVSSVIFVKDIQVARRFYEGMLQQKVLMDHGPNVGFESGFALWQVDHAHEIMHGASQAGEHPLGCDNFELYFETDNLDALEEQLKKLDVRWVHALREQPWGQRVMRVYDPDGHIVELAESMDAPLMRFLAQGMSVEEIARRTSMPLEIVQQIASAVNATH